MALRQGVQDGGIDRGIREKHAPFRQFVEIRCLGEIVQSSGSFNLRIDGSLPAPIIGKGEEDVRPIRKDKIRTQ